MLANDTNVPHLTTAMTGPLQQIELAILNKQLLIESWLRSQWQLTPPPFYSSVDLRNAGFKFAPVDTNLFPAGFNNLSREFLPLCIQAIQNTVEKTLPGCQRVLLIPENHTRNTFYFESLATLMEIFQKAGYEIRIGSMAPEITSATTFELPSKRKLSITPLTRKDNKLYVEDFKPCLILLNNDLSEGIPDILKNLEQLIAPSLNIGWSTRSKTHHFELYAQVCNEFSELIGIDPWLIAPLFQSCGEVDFMTGTGEACLKDNAQQLFSAIKSQYQHHQIELPPFIAIKADAGTYGMGVMMINNITELENLNRKERTRMATTKGGQKIHKVLIQEGVYTLETVGKDQAVAEPVVYMIGNHVVGGFYRVHTNKDVDENLNAPGMHFEPLAFCAPCNTPDIADQPDCHVNRFYVYGVIARLALLAAARELGELTQ